MSSNLRIGLLLFYGRKAAGGRAHGQNCGRVSDPIHSHISWAHFMSNDDLYSFVLGMIPGFIFLYLEGGIDPLPLLVIVLRIDVNNLITSFLPDTG